MVYIMLLALILLLSALFHIAALLRLSIPLAYALVVPTLFRGWYHAHQALGDGIFFAMLALAALSWVVTIVGRIHRWIDRRREDSISTEIYLRRMREAVEQGKLAPGGGYQIRVDDLWRDMD
ncbi:molecular chaperone GrpE [Pseudoflavonifractor phocaeensis]|uniref:molecular chaperone GrpE n=1 Tax=Pseudoflavonifractor phocaeensis TaxID=1870988 RepID=UPI0019561B0B|nr:molecular chaperone GrpE [Pseudoflavonifractor phocaeensis]MBM6927171.1 molecular chaperone GrpE [Pseudoflavonifractor phocaeensis]